MGVDVWRGSGAGGVVETDGMVASAGGSSDMGEAVNSPMVGFSASCRVLDAGGI